MVSAKEKKNESEKERDHMWGQCFAIFEQTDGGEEVSSVTMFNAEGVI